MSNNKQSSVESLFQKLWDTPKDKFTWYAILEEHKAIHQEEIERAYYEGIVIVMSKPDDDMLQLSQQYYNETFNNDEQ